ncbi:MAG: recombinase zinc beta ribbon domain-containing protein, partial [Planctomycetaceae bacterium]|nr:recombinase zinc beta ribbon domain-containing protein [Planctomycetaceae bacterium]
GGLPITNTSLHKMLTNLTYLGKVKYRQEIHEGEHQAIIASETWQQVQALLSKNGRNGGTEVRNRFGALLKGLLRCSCCDAAMVPSITKEGDRRYRCYVCSSAQKLGWHTCPSKSVPAAEIGRFVVSPIRSLGADPVFAECVLGQMRCPGNSGRWECRSHFKTISSIETCRRGVRNLQRDARAVRSARGVVVDTEAS